MSGNNPYCGSGNNLAGLQLTSQQLGQAMSAGDSASAARQIEELGHLRVQKTIGEVLTARINDLQGQLEHAELLRKRFASVLDMPHADIYRLLQGK